MKKNEDGIPCPVRVSGFFDVLFFIFVWVQNGKDLLISMVQNGIL